MQLKIFSSVLLQLNKFSVLAKNSKLKQLFIVAQIKYELKKNFFLY